MSVCLFVFAIMIVDACQAHGRQTIAVVACLVHWEKCINRTSRRNALQLLTAAERPL